MKGAIMATTTVGHYLATRLREIGLDHYFQVPGDYNLQLLDEMLKVEDLKMISCTNERPVNPRAPTRATRLGAAVAYVRCCSASYARDASCGRTDEARAHDVNPRFCCASVVRRMLRGRYCLLYTSPSPRDS